MNNRLHAVSTSLRIFAINLARIAKLSWSIDKRNTISYSCAMVTQVISSIGGAYLAGRVVTELFDVIANDAPSGKVIQLFIIGSVLLIIEQVAWRLMSFYQDASYITWHTQLSPDYSKKIAQLDIARFEDPAFSKLINKVSQDQAWKPANYVFHALNLVHGLLRLLATMIALFTFSPLIVLIIVVGLLPSVFVQFKQSTVKYSIWETKGDSSRRFLYINGILQNKQDIMDIRVFGLVDYLVDFTRKLLNDFNGAQQKTLRRYITPAILVRIIEGTIIGAVNFWLIMRVIGGSILIGQYTFYSSMVNQFNSSLSLVLNSFGIMYDYNLYMTDYFKLMDTPDLLPRAKHPHKIGSEVPEIRFDNVRFKYPHTEQYIFDGLTLTIKPSESIALVGENGAGKSTLIKLLLRYYDVESGAIYIDNVNIKNLDINSWYRHVSALLQNFSRYPFTIKENVHMGRIREPLVESKLERALELGDVQTIASEYPKGIDTILDSSFDEGVEPSGGQWQRVALSRAFYRNANVLILDEPTAAIDANAEYKIFKNITENQKSKTTIIVSHRFSTVRTADHIYVLEHGRITEDGTHSELMKQKGMYAKMFSSQAEGYK